MSKLWLLALLVLVPLVSAYEVNAPLDIKVKLQYDNGTALSDVVSQACIASIYSASTEDLLLRDVNMTPGAYHGVTFTPNATGEYTVSIRCGVGNETVTYHEDFTITPVITGGGGGQVLNLNVKILPERRAYTVNVQADPTLSFTIQYSVGGRLQDSHEATWRLVREDAVVAKGYYKVLDTGVYEFDHDFGDALPGGYSLLLDFDGRSEIVTVAVVNRGAVQSLLTGLVASSDGKVSWVRAFLSLLFLLILLMLFALFVWRFRRKK